ncbi:MAG TPA: methyltransferase [Acidimicrobiales bacterium]|nr:methyltransferase [Acidimicrobiales bacterium]
MTYGAMWSAYRAGRRYRRPGGTIGTMPEGHYFDARPAVTSRPSEVDLVLPEGTVRLRTDRGVFSGNRVDPGTAQLLKVAGPPPPTGDLLDLGCGYGPIAVTLACRSPGATVWAVDINERALRLVRENVAALKLPNVRPVRPDDVPAEVRFAGLWSNPPIRVGKQSLHRLLADWLGRLTPDGCAWLVVQKHLGSDSLASWLGDQGLVVRRRASKQGYRILEVTRE